MTVEIVAPSVHGIGQDGAGFDNLKLNDYRPMALDDVTHDRALPRNLVYSQIGGGGGNRTRVFYLYLTTVYMLSSAYYTSISPLSGYCGSST